MNKRKYAVGYRVKGRLYLWDFFEDFKSADAHRVQLQERGREPKLQVVD